MKYIDSESHDPCYNLALEEYVLLNFQEEDYLLLWNSEESIVVGKYQNVYEEVNLKEVTRRNVPVLRRISGGGTVYHDKMNLNYSMILGYHQNRFASYDVFLDPMISALNRMGIAAHKRRTCDIAISDKKISGSAQTIKKDRILHHGTLLYDSDLSHLHVLLKPTDAVIESKAVKSFRSQVTNIRAHLPEEDWTIDQFKERLLREFFPNGVEKRILTLQEREEIRKLSQEKYQSWSWNYGASPKFTFYREGEMKGHPYCIKLDIKEGHIIDHMIQSTLMPDGMMDLTGVRYDLKEIQRALENHREMFKECLSVEELTSAFF